MREENKHWSELAVPTKETTRFFTKNICDEKPIAEEHDSAPCELLV